MAFNLFNSMNYLRNAVDAFRTKLLIQVTANREQCRDWLDKSVGIVTALLPHIGYENSAMLAREAYTTGRPIRDIVQEKGILPEKRLSEILSPEQMTTPGIAG